MGRDGNPVGLRVGTLDALMLLSDEVSKFDNHAETALRRIVRALEETKSSGKLDLKVHPTDGGPTGEDPAAYMNAFKWDEAKFPKKGALPDLASSIYNDVCEQDEEVKVRLAEWSQVKAQLSALERKRGGNLMVKDMSGLVDSSAFPEHQDGTFSEMILP